MEKEAFISQLVPIQLIQLFSALCVEVAVFCHDESWIMCKLAIHVRQLEVELIELMEDFVKEQTIDERCRNTLFY